MAMSKYDHQEADITFAHGKWMRNWDIDYPSTEEGDARFEDFKYRVLQQPFIPASEPLWDLMNNDADQPIPERMVPVVIKQEDGSIINDQEADLKIAFYKWKLKWDIEYPSTEEEEARFQDFKKNILLHPFIPASDPLWDLLNEQADKPGIKNFKALRIDICPFTYDDSDYDELPDGLSYIVPVKKEDGTVDLRCMTPEEFQRYSGIKLLYDTKEEDQDDATIKHQSTALPVKRTSSDDKDDTVKRENIGCDDKDDTVKRENIGFSIRGAQKPGCCSGCG